MDYSKLINLKKIIIDIPGYNQWNNEGPFSKNINPHSISVGEIMYYNDSDLMSVKDHWKRIKITGVRSGVLFFIFTKNPKKEYWMSYDCIAIRFGQLMPLKYIVDTKKFPIEYYEFKCRCPYTKIVYK